MSTTIVVAKGVNTFGPIGGTGTGEGYYDGATNDTASSCGSLVTPPTPPAQYLSSDVNVLSDSDGGATPGFCVAIAGTLAQNAFDTISFNNNHGSGTLASAAATFSHETEGAHAYTLWRWAATLVFSGSTGNTSFTLAMATTPPSIVQNVPVVTGSVAELSWTPTVGTGADAGTFTAFNIYRDAVFIASVAPAVTSYDDTSFQSGSHTYEIQGIYTVGAFSPVISNDETICTDPFNCDCTMASPWDTLVNVRGRMLVRLGYPNQVASPPPGMAALIDEFLRSAQRIIYRQVQRAGRQTERFYHWTMEPGQRFYGLQDSEDCCGFKLDPEKVTWVGFEDLNNAWYRLDDGIPPEYYTRANINFGWPTRFEIRACIEIFPAPQAAYTLWVKGDFGLAPLVADSDTFTIDDEAVFLLALGNAKTHYGQKDAQLVLAQAGNYMKGVVAGTHGTKRYVPRSQTENPLTPPRFLPLGQDQA